jgi:hypothetical protein
VLLEEAGVPATVLITEPFQGIVASHAARLGAPGYHALVVPHPVWSQDDDGLEALARQVADVALAQLTAG